MSKRKQLEATTNRLPSFPCSAVVERSDSAGIAGGGLAGGELADASAVPFVNEVSCAWDSGASMCASLDATLKELRKIRLRFAGCASVCWPCYWIRESKLVDGDTPRMKGRKGSETIVLPEPQQRRDT